MIVISQQLWALPDTSLQVCAFIDQLWSITTQGDWKLCMEYWINCVLPHPTFTYPLLLCSPFSSSSSPPPPPPPQPLCLSVWLSLSLCLCICLSAPHPSLSLSLSADSIFNLELSQSHDKHTASAKTRIGRWQHNLHEFFCILHGPGQRQFEKTVKLKELKTSKSLCSCVGTYASQINRVPMMAGQTNRQTEKEKYKQKVNMLFLKPKLVCHIR